MDTKICKRKQKRSWISHEGTDGAIEDAYLKEY